jgi:hypothetical protein
MPSPPKKPRSPVYVAIVSNNPETLDGLQSYFKQAGVPSHGTRAVHDLGMVAPEFATAAVIFPDDFKSDEALLLVRELRRLRPRLLALIVTREPNRFRSVTDADGRSLPPIVLPRPSFGWDILDAIRAHAQTAAG